MLIVKFNKKIAFFLYFACIYVMYLAHCGTGPGSKLSLSWLARITEWLLMLLVFTRSNLISPRPSDLTQGQLLIDISCNLISPRFSFALSINLIHPPFLPPSPPPPPPPLLLANKDGQTESLSLGIIFQKNNANWQLRPQGKP